MRTYFDRCFKIGKDWEARIVPWLENYFNGAWRVVDTSHIRRDSDGNQFPDFTLVQAETKRIAFFDAKKRRIYKHRGHAPSFGIDKKFYTSYTNVKNKHNTKCYIGFYDPDYDADNWYLLDLDNKEDFIFNYGNNGFGEPICYRWYVKNLMKFEL